MSARSEDVRRDQGTSPRPPADEATEIPLAGVVVGLDGSPSSWDAFFWACGEAQRRGQRLLAVFVSHAAGANPGAAVAACALVPVPVVLHEWERASNEQAAQLLAEVERCAKDRQIELSFVHCRGDATRELLRTGVAAKADLIVVGRSAKAWHHLAGSISRQLVSKAGAPVVVVVP